MPAFEMRGSQYTQRLESLSTSSLGPVLKRQEAAQCVFDKNTLLNKKTSVTRQGAASYLRMGNVLS